jgi:hypothetical protein
MIGSFKAKLAHILPSENIEDKDRERNQLNVHYKNLAEAEEVKIQ